MKVIPRHFTVIAGEKEYPVRELLRAADELDSAAANLVGIQVPDGPLTAAALLWVQRVNADAVFLHAEIPIARAVELARRLECSHLLTGSVDGHCLRLTLTPCESVAAKREPGPCHIGLLTSGTTGVPKRIEHTWDSLAASVAVRLELRGARWISLYPLTRFAGFNTLLHALYNDATLIVPRAIQPSVIIEEIRRTLPTHASGTPTLWRNLLMAASSDLQILSSLRQITLGGEVVDQQILSALKSAAPRVRLTHIYASTELGVCVSVSDGLAGFPVEWLDNGVKATQLQIRDGELWINRSNSSALLATSPDGWAATGDIVEMRGGRVHITGRRTDVLNIGGAKVLPSEVEERLTEVPGVIGARVMGRRNSISGAVVAADIVGEPGMDQAALRTALFRHCRACLPAYAVPRIITFVNSLPITASGKILENGNLHV